MNKKGISHVEVLLSFLIFVGFVLFAFYFFSPIQTGRIVDSSIEYAFGEIKKEANVVVESYSLSLNLNGVTGSSVSVQITDVPAQMNVRVEDYLGETVNSKRMGDEIIFDRDDTIYDNNRGFAQIYFSEDMASGDMPDTSDVFVMSEGEDNGQYQIASSNRRKILSEKKLLSIKTEYEIDYFSLKEKFNLPSRANFGFEIIFSETEKISTQREIPEGIQIFAKSEKLEVLRENGERIFADVLLKVW